MIFKRNAHKERQYAVNHDSILPLFVYICVCSNYAPYSQLITIVVVPFVSVMALSAL